jgi:hypothetical protein
MNADDFRCFHEALRQGQPPDNAEVLLRLTVGREAWLDFLCQHYLDSYIPAGGSKVKLLIGREGSGKTHSLLFLKHEALARGYLVSFIDASQVKLQHFNALYSAIVAALNLEQVIQRYCYRVIQDLGYDPADIPPSKSFWEWGLEQSKFADNLAGRQEVQVPLRELIRNRRLDNTFAVAMMQLAALELGLELSDAAPGVREELLRWMRGEKADPRVLRRHHIFSRIDRYNSRSMLRSLLEVGRLAGFKGLLVCLDRLEDLMGTDPQTGRFKYTRAARDDAYESIRQIIDDIDNLQGIFFLMAGRTALIQDEHRGVKSYEALWMRLQNEIISPKFNKFADLVNIDTVVEQCFPQDWYLELQRRVEQLCQEWQLTPAPPDPDVKGEGELLKRLEQHGPLSPVRELVASAAGRYLAN